MRHGATVAVMDWDSHRYLESYFAIPMMGATLFTVNVRLAPHQIAYTLNDSEAEIVLVHADFVPMLEAIKDELTSVREVVVLADGQAVPANTLPVAGEYEALVGQASPDFEFGDFNENTEAATFYTSGTTGDPKGVYYSHRQIVLHTMATAMTLCAPRAGQRIHREDVYMPLTPMFHALAWGFPFIAVTLGLNRAAGPLPSRGPAQAETSRTRSRCRHCVPTILQMLLQAGRGVQAGSGRLDGDHRRCGAPARVVQGRPTRASTSSPAPASETGPVVTLAQIPPGVTPADADDDVRRRSRTGRPVPFVDLRVVDAEMRDVPRDGKAQGEIVLRSPFSTQGYSNKPQATEELWAGGYLHTQDVAVMFADGSVQIVDRIKDVIKTGGEWVSSIGLESLIGDVAGCRKPRSSASRTRSGGNGRWRSSSVSPTRRSTQTRSAPTCSLWSNQTASASTRCPRSTASPSSPKSRRRASARSTRRCCASATRDDGGAPPRWPLRPWRSPSCTNCEPAATNLRQSPVATR